MEQPDMSVAQCKQIRERFLSNSRQHLLAADTKFDRPGHPVVFSRPSSNDALPRPGKSEA